MECFETFWNSEIFAEIKACEVDDILEIEDLSHFFIDELKVFVSMDFCLTKDGKVVIYDWKTGKSENNATSEQLALHVDMTTRRSGDFPQHVLDSLDQMATTHLKLDIPPQVVKLELQKSY